MTSEIAIKYHAISNLGADNTEGFLLIKEEPKPVYVMLREHEDLLQSDLIALIEDAKKQSKLYSVTFQDDQFKVKKSLDLSKLSEISNASDISSKSIPQLNLPIENLNSENLNQINKVESNLDEQEKKENLSINNRILFFLKENRLMYVGSFLLIGTVLLLVRFRERLARFFFKVE